MRLQNLPALKFAAAFICGILLSSYFSFNSTVIIFLIFFISVFFLFSKSRNSLVVSGIILTVLVFLSGVLRFNVSKTDSILPSIPDMYPKRSVIITGIVNDIPDYDTNRVKFPFILQNIISGKDTLIVNGQILVTSYKPLVNKYSNSVLPLIKAGDKLSITGYLHDGSVERNPGEFDYRKYLRLHNIDKLFTNINCTEIDLLSTGNLNFFYQWFIYPLKYYVFEQINKNIPGNEGAFLNGLITGIRSDLTEEVKQNFIDSGTSHIIAVSGLNVVYIVLIITLVLMLFRVPVLPRIITTVIMLIYYCYFTGVTPSIVRATIMGSLLLIGYVIQRKPVFLNIIGFSAIVILLIDPKQLFDNGFILSFVSLISILLVYQRLDLLFLKGLKDKVENRIYRIGISILELALATFAAAAGTLPFNIAMFGKISISAFFANIIAIPLSNISLAIGIFQIVISFFSSSLSNIIAGVNYFLIKFLLAFISLSAGTGYSFISIPYIDVASSLVYYLIFFSLLIISRHNYKVVTVILIFSVSFFFFHSQTGRNELKITFLDVGQGDCAIIQTEENKTILVDCGMNSMFINSGERSILPYLQRNGIEQIDLLIITHLHMDHIGGMKYLLENIPVRKIYESGQNIQSTFVHAIDSIATLKNIDMEIIREGFTNSEFKNMKLYFIFPNSEFINSDGMTVGNNLNNGSLVFKLLYKNSSVLFTGDIEKYAEEDITERYGSILKSDILKAPHHGSYSSSTIPFIDNVHPEYAVISCGKFNRFNHPSGIIIERYKMDKINTLRTDMDNAVIFEYKDGGLKNTPWK
ncbi:DNA internalization-related competence protein ComEC/Rec2 [soil metagenome]